MKLNLGLFKKILALCLVIFFAIGVYLGGGIFRNFKYIKDPQVLNLLFYNNFISLDTIHEIENDNNLKINVDFADSLFELEEKLKDPKSKYDLISIYSFQALELDEEARLQPINWAMIKNQKNISPDFMSLGGDEIAKKLLPISWGVNGFMYDPEKFSEAVESWSDVFKDLDSSEHMLLFDIPISVHQLGLLKIQSAQKRTGKPAQLTAPQNQNLESLLKNLLQNAKLYHFANRKLTNVKEEAVVEISLGQEKNPELTGFKFVIPKEGGLFWTLNLAEPRFAPHPKEIATFLNAVLEKKTALEILKSSHFSSTSQILNAEDIEPNLKALYIRDIPLTSLKFQMSFPDSGLFSQLIEQTTNAQITK